MRCVREWLCRWFGPPATDGWEAIVRRVVRAPGLYVDHANGVIGAPVEWSLMARLPPNATWGAINAPCCITGSVVSGATRVDRSDPLRPRVDLSDYGVRCARCRRPLHVQRAFMRELSDVPMCPDCRPEVLRVIRLAKETP